MKYEKRNPLPPGAYWLDLFTDKTKHAYWSWIMNNVDTVTELKREEHPNHRRWVLFQVTAPTERWGVDAGLGLPTISTGAISSQATAQAPAPTPVVDYWANEVKTAWESQTGDIARAVGLMALIYFVTKERGK